jgi:Fe-S-cluster containining protein
VSPELQARGEHVPDLDARAGERWYEQGLRFECTGCGRCCTGGEGHVWVEVEEIVALARRLSLPLDEFGRRYLRRIGQRYALLERVPGGDCVFLRDNRCSVYEARPRQCATFPFWAAHLKSPETWAAAARACEGIREQAPLISCSEIGHRCASPRTVVENGVGKAGE